MKSKFALGPLLLGSILAIIGWDAAAQTKLKPDILWRAGGSVGVDRFSPDGTEFSSGSTVWTRSGRQRITLAEGGVSAFSPNGQDLVGMVEIGISYAPAIGVWSRATGELNRVISLQGLVSATVVLSPDGNYLAASGTTTTSEQRVRLINYATGLLVTNVPGATPIFSPDSLSVAVTGPAGVSLLSTADGNLQRSLPIPAGSIPKFSPNWQRLAFYTYNGTNTELQVVRVADGSLERTLPATNSVDFAFLADNNLLVATEGALVRVWSLADGQLVRTFTGHADAPPISISRVSASPKGDRVVSIEYSRRKRAILWSATTGTTLLSTEDVSGVDYPYLYAPQFTPDGDELAITRASFHVYNWQGTACQFWRTSDGSLAAEIEPAHRGNVQALGFSPDGRHLVTGVAGSALGIYDQFYQVHWTNDTRVQVWRVADGVREAELQGAASAVTAVAISSAGVVAGGAAEGTLHFWRLDTGEHLAAVGIGSDIIRSLAFSPDGSQIAVATESGLDSAWGSVSVWSVPDGSQLALLEASGDAFTSVAWSPDGQFVAGGAYRGTPSYADIRLWSATDGSLTRTFLGDRASVPGATSDMRGLYLDFSPTGDRLLIGSWEGMRLVNVANGKILRVWNVPSSDGGYFMSASFAANGIHILAGREYYNTTTKFGANTSVGSEWYSTSNALPLYRQIGEYHGSVATAEVSPSGLYYAVGSEDGTLYLARSPIYNWNLKATPTIAGGGLTLSWSADLAGFVLQSATTLTNGGDWQDSSLTPIEANGQKSVTVPPTGSHGFFRLRGP